MDNVILQSLSESIITKQTILADKELIATIEAVAEQMTLCLKHGGKVLWCGNGGSAADAQHLAAELSGRFYYDRAPLNSEALHCNSSFLTAVANDYGYDHVYERLLRATAKQGDIVVGISTSGNSANIVQAFQAAQQMGVRTIAMTGLTGGKMAAMSDYLINVPSTNTPRIQEAHITIGHIICQIVEANLFPQKDL